MVLGAVTAAAGLPNLTEFELRLEVQVGHCRGKPESSSTTRSTAGAARAWPSTASAAARVTVTVTDSIWKVALLLVLYHKLYFDIVVHIIPMISWM